MFLWLFIFHFWEQEQIVQVGEKRKLSSEWNEEADNTRDESEEDDQNDEDEKEESALEGTDSEDREQEEAEKSKEEQNEIISSETDSGTKIRDKVAGKDTPVKSSKSSYESTKKSALKKDAATTDASPKPKVVSAKRQKVEKDNVKEKASSRKLSEKDGMELLGYISFLHLYASSGYLNNVCCISKLIYLE